MLSGGKGLAGQFHETGDYSRPGFVSNVLAAGYAHERCGSVLGDAEPLTPCDEFGRGHGALLLRAPTMVLAAARALTLKALRVHAAVVTLVQARVALELNFAVALYAGAVREQASEVLGGGRDGAVMPHVSQQNRLSVELCEVLHVGHCSLRLIMRI